MTVALLKELRGTYGEESEWTLSMLTNLARMSRACADYPKAEKYYLEAHGLLTSTLGTDAQTTMSCKRSLGLLYCYMGRYSEAERIFEEALAHAEARNTVSDAKTYKKRWLPSCLNRMGLINALQGRFSIAKEFYEKSMRAYQNQFETDFPRVARELENVAEMNIALGRWVEARSQLRRVREADQKRYADNYHKFAADKYLGELELRLANFAIAGPLLETALDAIAKQHQDGSSPQVVLRQKQLLAELNSQTETMTKRRDS